MKIGIGVLTYNRPEHLENFYHQSWKYTHAGTPAKLSLTDGVVVHKETKDEFHFRLADDSKERKGIAYRTNECLRALKDCDYIFLFNDDCFPIKSGWVKYFIHLHQTSYQHHFLYLRETPTIKKIKTERTAKRSPDFDINIYNNCAGCFMFLTKEAIEKVGAFDGRFGIYGFEHADYSDRVHMAGLTPMGKYLCPAGAGEYIYSLDLDNHLPFNKQLNHKPSMTALETINCLKVSEPIYKQKEKSVFLPL